MARYHLHFTDGVDFVLDRAGTEIPHDESVQRVAFGSALGLMRSLPTYRDWEKWVVAIHDEGGFQLEVLPFPDHRVFSELLWQAGSGMAQTSAVPATSPTSSKDTQARF